MIAENSRTPYMPRLEIADAPPWYSCGLELLVARARAARSFISSEIADSDLLLGLADHRRDQAAFDRDRDADIGMLEAQDAVVGPHRVRRRHALQRERQRLDDEVVDRELVGRLPSSFFGAPALASSRSFSRRPIVDVGVR